MFDFSAVDPLRSVFTFLVGGLIPAILPILLKGLGPRLSGVLSSMPSTLLLAFVFQAVYLGVDVFVVGVLPNALISLGLFPSFVLVYAALYRFGSLVACLGGSVVWGGVAFCVASFVRDPQMDVALLVCVVISVIASVLLFCVTKVFLRSELEASSVSAPPVSFLGRFAVSGALVSCAVLASEVVNPQVGGFISAYPANTTACLLSAHGVLSRFDFALYVRTFVVSGLLSSAVFVLAVCVAYPYYGVLVGTVLAYAGCAVSVFFVMKLRGVFILVLQRFKSVS